jgi:CHAT domain-containing protein/Tfp pilus assembly protein PilF
MIIIGFCTNSFSQLLSENYHSTIQKSRYQNIDLLLKSIDYQESDIEKAALIAELYFLKGRNDKANDLLDSLLTIGEPSINSKSELHARLLKNYGLILWNQGKDDQALEYLRQSLSRYENINEIDQENIGDLYNNIGLVYAKKDSEQAIANYEDALKIYKVEESQNLDKIIQLSINISLVEVNRGNFVNALRFLNEALNKWLENHEKGLPTEAFIKANIGAVYLTTNQLVLASDYLEEAKKLYLQNYGERHSELANVSAQLADLALRSQQYKNALNHIQFALKSNSFQFDKKDISFNPSVNDANKLDLQLVLLLRKANILESFYYGYSLKKSHLISALDAIDMADEVLLNIRASTTNQKDLIDLSNTASELYEDAQRIALQMDEVTLMGDEYLVKAFQYAEKSKSSLLFNAVIESEAKSFARIPESLLEKEKELSSDMAYLNTQISLESELSKLNLLRDQYFQLKLQYEKFTDELEERFPEYYKLKHQKNNVNIEKIQERLNSDEAIIEYVMAPKSNQIFLYFITKSDFSFHRIYDRENVLKFLRAYRNTMVYNLEGSFQKVAYELHQDLLPFTIDKAIKKLIIIPDGELSTIPFESLIIRMEENSTFYNLDYLIESYEVNYSYSATLLQNQSVSNYGTQALLISPVNFGDGIGSLPASKAESDHFELWCDQQSMIVDALIENDATKARFQESDLESYRYIHLATHGMVNMDNPDLSGVYFKNTKGSSDDNILYVGEIYGLSINAELVVLSACETGLGKINRGEGVMGLGQAFAYSGADNLILSLWKVADESTSQLMRSFYEGEFGSDNQSFSKGLRKAKLDLINSDFSAPYYWAPFILWGK